MSLSYHEASGPRFSLLPGSNTQFVVSDKGPERFAKRYMANSRRVLIVDDNVDLAENIAEILQIDGHRTEVASSAEEALERVLGSDLDAVVTDYRLPGISGALFIERIRKNGNPLLAVVISAYTDDQTIREAQEAGATFMAKPVDFKVLSQWIRAGSA